MTAYLIHPLGLLASLCVWILSTGGVWCNLVIFAKLSETDADSWTQYSIHDMVNGSSPLEEMGSHCCGNAYGEVLFLVQVVVQECQEDTPRQAAGQALQDHTQVGGSRQQHRHLPPVHLLLVDEALDILVLRLQCIQPLSA